MVTAGAASALTLGTAACMSVANRAAVHSIPTDLEGLKTEVIVQKAHRYDYDHAMRNCGVSFRGSGDTRASMRRPSTIARS